MKLKRIAETKFFKVLVDDFTEKLTIPPLFMRAFKESMPMEPILESEKGKFPVSVESNDNGFFFFNRGWGQFVKDHDLQTGDFLVFNLVDDKTFEVDIYGRTCCLKGLNLDFHEKGTSCKDREVNVTPKKEISFKKRGRPKLHHRKKPQVYARKSGGNAQRRPKVQENTEMSHRERVAEAIRAIDPKHPFFKLALQNCQKYTLVVPKRFVDKAGLESKRNAVIKDSQGRVFSVDIRVANRQVRLSTGWSAFYKANGLATGDTCVFQFSPEKGNLIEVQIIKKEAEIKS